MKKTISLLVAIIIIVLSFNGCSESKKDLLLGQWKRVEPGTAFDGLIIEVEHLKDDTYRATIISMSDKMVALGFRRGELKWDKIALLEDGSYFCSDLGKKMAPNNIECYSTWYDMYIHIDPKKPNAITLSSIAGDASTNTKIGSKQIWWRVSS